MQHHDEFRDIVQRLYAVISQPARERDWDNERDGLSLQEAGLLPGAE